MLKRNKNKTTLFEKVEVNVSQHFVTIECKDLDEIITKAELCEALWLQLSFQSVSETNIIRMRNPYGDTEILQLGR